ncbi:hypothetical protein [Labilibaculum filiforme]|nr:hypothetical protein [Labilibaculum filiforme]
MDRIKILKQLESARNKYKPEEIKTLIVGEAPPDSIERFFYYEDVKKADYLFLGIIGVLYPSLKNQYMDSKRNPVIKEQILKKFVHDGFFLLDLFEFPVSMNTDTDNEAVNKLIIKIDGLGINKAPLVLIKANVYDTAFVPLRRKFNVTDKRIDFPSCGNQQKFHDKFSEVIKRLG